MNLSRRLASYSAAIFVPIIAFALRELLAHRYPGQMPPFITLFPGVMVVAILYGLAPGVVATVVSALIAVFWVFAFRSIFVASSAGGAMGLAVFIVTGIAVSILAEQHQRARSRAAVAVSLRDTESALRRYELLASQSQDVILFMRLQDGRILEANQAAAETYGYSREELLSLSILDLRAAETREEAPRQMGEAYLNSLRFETLHCRKDGTTFPVEVVSRGVAIGDERILLTSIRDITKRKQDEAVLRESQAQLEAALSSMADAVCIVDTDRRFRYCNDAFNGFHRFKSGADCPAMLVEFQSLVDLITSEGEIVPVEMRPLARALRGETGTKAEYVVRRNDTGESWIGSYSFSPVRDRDGSTIGAVEVVRDVTDRSEAEAARARMLAELDRNNRELRALLGAATATVEGQGFPGSAVEIFEYARQATGAQSGCLALLNADGSEHQILACNSSGIQLPDCGSGECRCAVKQGSPEAVLALREQACRRKRPAFRNDFPRDESLPPGAFEIANFLFVPLEISGEVHGVVGLANKPGGFTESDGQTAAAFGKLMAGALEKNRYLDALRVSEERFRSLYENATIGLYRTTPDGKILLANPALVRMLGFSSLAELGARNLEEETGREPNYDRAAFKRRAESGEVIDLESAWIRKDGSTVFVRESARAIRNPAGETIYYEGTVEDITERRQAEEALRRNEARYRAVVEDSGERVIFTDENRLLLYRSPSRQLTGFSDGERLGRDVLEVMHPDDAEVVRQAWADVLQDPEKSREVEYRLRCQDGSYRWVQNSVRNMLANPNVQAIVARIRDDSERRLAQDSLRESEAKFRAIVESSHEGISFLAADGRILYRSPAFHLITGYRDEDRLGDTWLELIHPDDLAAIRESFEQLAKEPGAIREMHYRLRHKGGELRWVVTTCCNLLDKAAVRAIISTTHDVTLRKLTEDALRNSEATNRITFEQAAVGIAHVAIDGRWLQVNDKLCEIVGYTREEMMGLRFQDLTHPDDLSLTDGSIRRILAGETEFFAEEKRYVRKDGSIVWVHVTVSLARNAAGEPRFYLAVTQDISARKEAERRLQQSEAEARARADELAALLDAVPAVTFIAHDRQCRNITSSRSAQELLRLPPGANVSLTQAEGQRPAHYHIWQGEREVAPEELPLQRAAATGCEVRGAELSIVFDDGSSRTIYGNTTPLFDGNGEVRGAVGAYLDITDLKRIELELRRSRHSLQVAIDAANLGVWSRDLVNDHAIWDDRQREIYGLSAGGNISYGKFMSLVLPEDREALQSAHDQRVSSNEQISCEHRILKAGEVRWVHSRGSAVRDEAGNVIGVSGITMDITGHKRSEENMRSLQEQIRIAQRTEALGRLAGGMAHDFNNILMIIRSYAELLQSHVPERSTGAGYLVEMLKASDRAAGLTAQLLAFSRKQIAVPVVLDLNAVVKDTSKMLRRLIGEDVELVLSAAPALWHVQADPDQIVQVLMNLCVNARDAMPNGGKITIATENLSCAAPGEHPHLPSGDFVKLSVGDTGVGMAKEVVEHIFEPFFTTKPQGKGTGLGLSTVFGIVAQSAGYVWAESEPGCGTRLVCCLPRANQAVPEAEAPMDRALPRGTETVMVVEDEIALRDSICEALRDAGYTVLSAGPGEEALTTAAGHDAEITVLITDVVMPMMNGRELSEKLTAIRPGLKTIFMSGYSDDWVIRSGISEARVAFLQKPFNMTVLARKLREVIDHKP